MDAGPEQHALTEYQEVLHREQSALPYTHEEIERLLDGLCFCAEKVHLRSRWWPVLTGTDDEAMVHLAVESRRILSRTTCGICSRRLRWVFPW